MKAKRIIAFILTFLLIMNCMPVVFAEDAEPKKFDISGSKTADKDLLTDEDRDVTITLSLPSAEYKNEYDVVFVMDSSTSTVNSAIDFANNVNELLDTVVEKNAVVNVGVVKFRGLAFDTIYLASNGDYSGLVEYNDDTADVIKAAVNFAEADLKKLASGTNAHAGLRMAEDMLAKDTDIDAGNKYVFFLTDGKTYIWNDADDVPTTIYTQSYRVGAIHNGGAVKIGQWNGPQDKSVPSYNPVRSIAPTFWFDDYADLFASNSTDLQDGFEYDYRCAYAYKEGDPTGTVNVYTTSPSAIIWSGKDDYNKKYYEFVPNGNFSDMKFLEANPYVFVDNEDGETGYYDLNTPNPAFYMSHADSLQKGLYKAGHLWKDMSDTYGYHTAAIKYDKWGGNSGDTVARSFCKWVINKNNSEYGADITDTDAVKDVFDSIKDDILYMVASGTVADIIPKEFDIDVDSFEMTYDGVPVDRTAGTGEAMYFFGEAGNGVYPYELAYRTADKLPNGFENVTGAFSWTLNVPVENAHPITLSYKLTLKDKLADGTEVVPGDYDTNVAFTFDQTNGPVIDEDGFGAVLDYTTSDKETGVYGFEVPSVTYKKHYTVSYEYTGTVPEGAPALPEAASYLNGDDVIVADAPEMAYYTFSGWYTDEELTNLAEDFTMPAEDVTIYGSWEPIFYDITVNYVDADGNTLADSVTTDPIQAGTAYDVSELDQIAIDEYKWVSTSLDTKGDKLEKDLVIDVVYTKLGEYAVTVNYVDEAGNKIAESVVTTVQEGENYDVTALDQAAIAGYTYKETSGELTGTIGTEDITIDVIYTQKRSRKPSKDPDEPIVPEVPEEPAEPEVPEEPVVTVPEVPEEPAIIEEPEVPLAEPKEPLDIFEEEVPLADVPTTGDMTHIWLASFIFSALALGVLNLLGRREEEGSL